MTTELLKCESCYITWERVIVRGRKPRLCNWCRVDGVKIKPKVAAARKVVVLTDGGKFDAGYGGEGNDCTVRALAVACDVPYERAYMFMAENGRKRGRGAYFEQILQRNSYSVFERKLEHTDLVRARGVKTAMVRNPRLRYGTWIVKMKGHVATLKDGVLYDQFDSSRKDVLWAWRVK